jgi:hypothetical protein
MSHQLFRILRFTALRYTLSAVVILLCTFALADDPPSNAPQGALSTVAQTEDSKAAAGNVLAKANVVDEADRVSLPVARDRAKLMHDMSLSTLDVMHHRYFRGDRAVVPARAMEDVFGDMKRRYSIQAGWISASLSAMSLNHEPKSEFEKQAAEKIAKGEEFVETIEDGFYRRAASVRLTAGCISCHAGFFANNSSTPKFAGLIISVPVTPDSQLAQP